MASYKTKIARLKALLDAQAQVIQEYATELAKLREQKPVAYAPPLDVRNIPKYGRMTMLKAEDDEYATYMALYAAPVPAPALPADMLEFVECAAKQGCYPHPQFCTCSSCVTIKKARALLQVAKQAPAVPYGVDDEAANRIALAVYDCKNGINPEPLLYAINRTLATEAHPLSDEGQRALLQSSPQAPAVPDLHTANAKVYAVTEPDRHFLRWIHARLQHVHGEGPLYDYMHQLRAIIAATPHEQCTPNVCSYNTLEEVPS